MTKKLNILFLLAAFLPLIAFGQPHYGIDTNAVDYQISNDYEIGNIEITGNTGINKQVIIARSGLKAGDIVAVPGEDLSNAIKKLWRTKLFSKINIYREDKSYPGVIFLIIEVEERPRLTSYRFKGDMKSLEEDDIKEKIRLRRNDPVTEFDKEKIRNTIENHFIEKGYLFADAEIYEKKDTSAKNGVRMTIHVEKGNKVKIRDIHIHGNYKFASAKLRGQMKDTKEKSQFNFNPKSDLKSSDSTVHFGFFDVLGGISKSNLESYFGEKLTFRLLSNSKFTYDKFMADKEKLIQFYNNNGYRDANIRIDSIHKVDEASIDVNISIDEGIRYYFRNIKWTGNQKYPDPLLDYILGINRGEVYDQARLQQRLYFDPSGGDISSLYMDDGYLFFQINPHEVRIFKDSIDIEIRVIEGPQAIIDRIIIKGNDKTNEKVIRRELRTIPGNKFSRTDIIRSQREIASLSYFDPEQIGIQPIPHPESGTVDIEYTVVEKPSDQIELSAGWGGTNGGLYGSAGIVFNNFSLRKMFDPKAWAKGLPAGDGQQLSFRVQTRGKSLQSYTFAFTEPWLGGKKPNSFSTSLNYTFYNQTPLDRKDPESSWYASRSATVGLGKRLKWPDDYFYLMSSITYSNYQLQNFNQFVLSNGNSNNFYLKETISRVSTSGNPFYPEGGSSLSLTLQLTPPYSLFRNNNDELSTEELYKWVEYHKWRFNAEWFNTLIGSTDQRKLVLKLGAKLGFLGAYNKEVTGISPFERFRVGGDGLSGGFTLEGYDIISLRGTKGPVLPEGGTLATGANGAIFNKFTVELRYQLTPPKSQMTTIYAMLFLEGGNSYAGFDYYDPFKLHKAFGVGLRLYLPMFGLLGFDYGIPFADYRGVGFGDVVGQGVFQFKLGFEPD